VAEQKTGTLFRLAAELGATLGGLPREPARAFAAAFAVAFQVLDDVLDLEGGAALGKLGGTDLVQRVMTWPLIDWIESSADPELARARLLRRAEGELDALREEILDSGATRRAREVVAFQLGRARACLEGLAPSAGKSLLASLVREVAAR
jgi:geranylgeranyl pyrophosphate synthase